MEKIKIKQSISMSPDKKRIVSYAVVAIAIVVILSMWLWKAIVVSGNNVRFEKGLTELAQNQQQLVSNYLNAIAQQLTKHVEQENVQSLMSNPLDARSSTIDTEIFELQQHILSTIPHSQSARFYLIREAQQEKDAGGSIGFVELDMINRAETDSVVYPEVSKVRESSEWKIHWVMPIKPPLYERSQTDSNEPEPIATLYVSTTTNGLLEALNNNAQKLSQTQIVQSIGRQRLLKFLNVGQGGGYGVKTIDIPSSHWKLELRPSVQLVEKTSQVPLWLVALLAALTGIALAIAYKLAERKNQQQAALYHTLDITKPSTTDKEDSNSEEKQNTFDDPLYLSDQHLIVNEEDEALVTGAHQNKSHESQQQKGLSEPTGKGVSIPSHIFRAYDIRGIVDEELTPEITEAIGKAVATEALEQGETSLLVGYDARTHSPLLCEHLEKGILSTGCDVFQIGLVPTPLLNFSAIFSDQTSSGIIITASHNPKNYNGFKIVINERTLVDEDIRRLQERISNGVLTQGQTGNATTEDFSEDYIDTIISDIAINSGLHVVIDAGNGAASKLAPKVFEELGCEITPLFCEFDGEFPNHDPDPSVNENLQALIEKVKDKQADIGIALDGDGDRVVVVTHTGKIVWPDQLLMIFARDVVSRNPGCDVIFDIKSTRQLNQVISSYGGRPVMWKTGHSHIKAKMRETEALLAGEFSGHIFFKERWFGFDDGIYAAARLLEIMSLRDQSLDDMIAAMPDMYATPEIKIPVTEQSKFEIVERLTEEGNFVSGEKTTIDGLRVDFAKGWGLVRASNTAPVLTLRFEASNENGIEQLKTLFKRELQKIDDTLPLDF